MSSAMSILVFLKKLIFRRDILKMLKKQISLIWPPKKDEYTLLSNFVFEKKIDKYHVFSTKNIDKNLINS